MVGYDPSVPDLSQMEILLAGAVSGIVTRGICQPLDVLKIRFQLQTGTVDAKYKTIIQAVTLIVREEGVKSLWKGHASAQILSIIYGMTQFWTYEMLTKKAYDYEICKCAKSKPFVHFASGAVSGSLATLASFPFDVVRTRLVAQDEKTKIYKGLIHAFVKIHRNEGPLTFFRGLTPTVVQVAPHTGALFMFYKLFVTLFDCMSHEYHRTNIPLKESLTCGSLAGLCAKTVVYPFDLAKKRLQIQGTDMKTYILENNLACKGLIDCLLRTVKNEGLKGLFKGLVPTLIKALISSGLYFGVYEEMSKHLRNS